MFFGTFLGIIYFATEVAREDAFSVHLPIVLVQFLLSKAFKLHVAVFSITSFTVGSMQMESVRFDIFQDTAIALFQIADGLAFVFDVLTSMHVLTEWTHDM